MSNVKCNTWFEFESISKKNSMLQINVFKIKGYDLKCVKARLWFLNISLPLSVGFRVV